jgi:hypothetical protein
MKLTTGMRRYLRQAAKADMIRVETVDLIEPAGRLPKALFDCVENDLLEEVRDRGNGASCAGHTLVQRLFGWKITDAGRAAIAAGS